jgi:HD-GYP domain-containing protein (c-di-GMP phosphodiesterase class II)
MNFTAALSQFRISLTMGASLLALATLFFSPLPEGDWGWMLCLALAALSERWLLVLPRYGPFTLSEAMIFAVLLRFGPSATLLTCLVAGLSRFRRERNTRIEFVLYSLSQSWLAYGCAAWSWAKLRGLGPILRDTALLDLALMALLAGLVFAVQAYIVALHQWLEQKCLGNWSTRINWPRLRLLVQALMPLGILLVACLQERPAAVVLLLGPLWVTYSSIRTYTRTLEEAQQVVTSLAEAVERREPHTVGHALRVGHLACDLARYLKMPESEVRMLASAARLHELGKISLGDQILCKSGRLQDAEWERVRRYPEVGANVASHFSLSRRESVIIRHHQESFDGTGYPHQLKGQQIPLASRVLAVAKAFDAMISARSYRPAMTWQSAIGELRRNSGRQFDPQVVGALEAVLSLGLQPSRVA